MFVGDVVSANIGTGTEVSVLELIATLARAELALPPATPLTDGLATTLEWAGTAAARQPEHAG